MLSLALTDAALAAAATGLALRSAYSVGYRLAFTLLVIPALLGFLRFSGLYPLETWHSFFTLLSASAALPMLAVCAVWPASAVAQKKSFALIFLGIAGLLGIVIAGLGEIRIYDKVIALLSMATMLWFFLRQGAGVRAVGACFMLAGSVLFVMKVGVPGWIVPGDCLHIGMALGLWFSAPPRGNTFVQVEKVLP